MPQNKHKKKMHFEISERKVLLRIIDIASVCIAIYFLGEIFTINYFQNIYETPIRAGFLVVYLLAFGSVFEMYNLQVASNQFQTIKSVVIACSITTLVYMLTPYYAPVIPSRRIEILFFYLAVVGSVFVWRMLYVQFFAANRFKKNAILIAESAHCNTLVKGLGLMDPHYKVVGYVSLDDSNACIKNSDSVTRIDSNKIIKFVNKRNVSDIIIASKSTEGITKEIYNQVLQLLESGYNVREYSQVYEQLNQRIPVQYLERDFFKYFPFSRSNQNQLYQFSARTVDILFSVIGLLCGAALIPFILIINLFANKGSLFYTQERVGRNGRVFKIFKFRTMGINAEKDGAVFSTLNDVRVTPFGKIMRKSRIDEFPQFINILKGEMSIIGPRPERPVFVKQIAEKMPFYTTRHIIKPGLTGWAQVNYPYGETLEDSLVKLQYDLYYIKHRSIYIDINIMVKTFSTVLFYRGQ